MAAASITRKAMSSSEAFSASYVPAGWVVTVDNDKQRKIRVPNGYLPIVLVCDDDDDNGEGGARTTTTTAETRVLVRVSDLTEPCMAALLEAAEEQFAYSQQGVLKVPCDAQCFDHVVSMARKSNPKYNSDVTTSR